MNAQITADDIGKLVKTVAIGFGEQKSEWSTEADSYIEKTTYIHHPRTIVSYTRVLLADKDKDRNIHGEYMIILTGNGKVFHLRKSGIAGQELETMDETINTLNTSEVISPTLYVLTSLAQIVESEKKEKVNASDIYTILTGRKITDAPNSDPEIILNGNEKITGRVLGLLSRYRGNVSCISYVSQSGAIEEMPSTKLLTEIAKDIKDTYNARV